MGLGRRKVLVKGVVPTIQAEKPPELQQQTKKKRALQLGDADGTATGNQQQQHIQCCVTSVMPSKERKKEREALAKRYSQKIGVLFAR